MKMKLYDATLTNVVQENSMSWGNISNVSSAPSRVIKLNRAPCPHGCVLSTYIHIPAWSIYVHICTYIHMGYLHKTYQYINYIQIK